MAYCNNSKNVLVLEDSRGMRFALEELIERLGFVPYSCESRQEFLEDYMAIPYFAVILDNQVPYDKNGAIRKNVGITMAPQLLRREPKLKVALHAGEDMSPHFLEFERLGIIYLRKPVSIERLGLFLK